MSVSEVLAKEMERKGISKNAMIREIGIDRSTFYKIMNSTRAATTEQLERILKCLEADASLRLKVFAEYEKDREDERVYRSRASVKSFLNQLSDKDGFARQGESCPAAIAEAIHHAASEGNGKLSIFLPGTLMIQSGIYGRLIREKKERLLAVEYLSTAVETQDETTTLMDNIAVCLNSMGQKNLALHEYCLTNSRVPARGIPYPFYLITDDRLLLISVDAQNVLPVTDPVQIRAYETYFQDRLQEAKPLISVNGDNTEMFRRMSETFLEARNRGLRIYFITPTPCIMLTVTKEQLARYREDPGLLSYWELLHSVDCMEFTNTTGITALLQKRMIEESGFRIPIQDADIPILQKNLEERIGRNLFRFNDASIHMSEYWEIMVCGREKVVFSPFYEGGFAAPVENGRVASALADWCESRMQVINGDLLPQDGSGA